MKIMQLHIRKQSYDGYYVGTGVEYPGIVISANTDEDLVKKFQKALPGHKEALKRYGKEGIEKIEVIAIDG